MTKCTRTGCPNPRLGVDGIMGGRVLCREHVLAYYPGVTSVEEAQRVHAQNMAGALGYGEDCGDDVRQNLREWQPRLEEDLALLRAYFSNHDM